MSGAQQTETIDSVLEEFWKMERDALANLLEGKTHLYSVGHSQDEPKRTCESTSANHEVYRVDIKSVQKYLAEIKTITEQFNKAFPSNVDFPYPEADLRFLEIWGDTDTPNVLEYPYTLNAACWINFAHSIFKTPLELIIENEFSSINLSFTSFEKSLEIQIHNVSHLDLDARNAKFSDTFTINTYAPASTTAYATLAIKAQHASVAKSFTCQKLVISDAIFAKAIFNEKSIFRKVEFQQSACFINSQFAGGVLFSDCVFLKAPDFHGAELHQDTAFQKCYFETLDSVIADVASFRILKAHFAKMRDSRHELMFYALEQRTERKNTKDESLTSLISWLYDEVSGYGTSIDRALRALTLWNFNFFLFFHSAILVSATDQPLVVIKNEAMSNLPAAILTLQNTFNPLALFSDKSLASVNAISIYAASLIQSLGSIAILALFLLALRGRFRKGSGAEN